MICQLNKICFLTFIMFWLVICNCVITSNSTKLEKTSFVSLSCVHSDMVVGSIKHEILSEMYSNCFPFDSILLMNFHLLVTIASYTMFYGSVKECFIFSKGVMYWYSAVPEKCPNLKYWCPEILVSCSTNVLLGWWPDGLMYPCTHILISTYSHFNITLLPRFRMSSSQVPMFYSLISTFPDLPISHVPISSCSHVLMFPCPHVPMSSCSHVPMSSCSHVPISSCPHIPLSTYPNVLISPFLYVLMS